LVPRAGETDVGGEAELRGVLLDDLPQPRGQVSGETGGAGGARRCWCGSPFYPGGVGVVRVKEKVAPLPVAPVCYLSIRRNGSCGW
jgi:hypothetical protein